MAGEKLGKMFGKFDVILPPVTATGPGGPNATYKMAGAAPAKRVRGARSATMRRTKPKKEARRG